MSEYQYYEFQAVDRPLTPEEQAKVSSLSSRTTASAYSASFVYHWSDLPANEEDLLAKYFDALLYLANWGTSRLLFRFPRSAIETEQSTFAAALPDHSDPDRDDSAGVLRSNDAGPGIEYLDSCSIDFWNFIERCSYAILGNIIHLFDFTGRGFYV